MANLKCAANPYLVRIKITPIPCVIFRQRGPYSKMYDMSIYHFVLSAMVSSTGCL